MTVAEHFTSDCWAVSARLKKELRYNATRFNQMLGEHGGVETTRRLIRATEPSQGFSVLWENQRLELSVEALALLPWYAELFTSDELSMARRRLLDHRFAVDAYLARAESEPPAWVSAGTSVTENPDDARDTLAQLYSDALQIYERARNEVTIERKDGRQQKYAPVRYKRAIEEGQKKGDLVGTIARIIGRATLGFGHLAEAGRPDLMLETLVLDTTKPYHGCFSSATVQLARDRMDEYRRRRSVDGPSHTG